MRCGKRDHRQRTSSARPPAGCLARVHARAHGQGAHAALRPTSHHRDERDLHPDRAEPPTRWLADALTLDDHGFIVTGPRLAAEASDSETWKALGRDPLLARNEPPGVFAAGDDLLSEGSTARTG
jgi:hypothetical protein